MGRDPFSSSVVEIDSCAVGDAMDRRRGWEILFVNFGGLRLADRKIGGILMDGWTDSGFSLFFPPFSFILCSLIPSMTSVRPTMPSDLLGISFDLNWSIPTKRGLQCPFIVRTHTPHP